MPDEDKTNVPPTDQTQTPNWTPPVQEPTAPATPPSATLASVVPSVPESVPPTTPAPSDPPTVPSDPPTPSVPPAPPVPSSATAATVDPLAPVVTSPAATADPTAAVEYAGFWIRFLATLLDGVILAIPMSILGFVLFFIFFGLSAGLITGGAAGVESSNGAIAAVGLGSGIFLFFAQFVIIWLILMVVGYGYWVYFTANGGTLGKKALGLKVVDSAGNNIGIGKAILREVVGKWVSGIPLDLGFLWVAFDEKKQGWHDKIANTYVVKIR